MTHFSGNSTSCCCNIKATVWEGNRGRSLVSSFRFKNVHVTRRNPFTPRSKTIAKFNLNNILLCYCNEKQFPTNFPCNSLKLIPITEIYVCSLFRLECNPRHDQSSSRMRSQICQKHLQDDDYVVSVISNLFLHSMNRANLDWGHFLKFLTWNPLSFVPQRSKHFWSLEGHSWGLRGIPLKETRSVPTKVNS